MMLSSTFLVKLVCIAISFSCYQAILRDKGVTMDLKTEFLNSIKSGDVGKVKEMLKRERALIDAADDKGASAILLAVYYRKPEVVKALVGARQLNIFEAAATGNAARIRKLLAENRALADSYSPDGFPPLGLAAFFGHREATIALLEAGAPVNVPAKNQMKVTCMHAAAATGAIDLARLFIERGADVNARQQGGFTPLHEVAARGELEFAKLLIANGADVNVKNDEGKTPAMLALSLGQKEMVEFLRKNGANVP
jgi:ankyrin repeat protein